MTIGSEAFGSGCDTIGRDEARFLDFGATNICPSSDIILFARGLDGFGTGGAAFGLGSAISILVGSN